MNRDWIAVFEALKNVYMDGAYSNLAINKALSHHRGCKESFVRNYVKGVLRESIRLDYYIDELSENGRAAVKERTLIILRMGIYAMRSLGSVPEYAAVTESVELSKRVARGSAGFINAVLRAYAREKSRLAIPPDRLDIKYCINAPIIDLLHEQYGAETEIILKGLCETPLTIIRVNSLKAERDEVIKELRNSGIEAEASKESGNAVITYGSGIISSEMYKSGKISVQNLSSILSVEALAPEPLSNVLDMCSAPGGKAAYMAEIMNDSGTVKACDIHENRLKLIEKNSERLGLRIIDTCLQDGTEFNSEMEESFDYVLADVPCSGLGVMASKPELRFISDVSSYPKLYEIQFKILKNAVSYTKPGGRICYSTCTLNKNENEKIVERVLKENDPGLLSVLEMKTFMPYNCKVGFFYTTLEKHQLPIKTKNTENNSL